MKKYESIESRIESKDVEGLREAVANLCYICRDFSNGEFDEMVMYVESKGIKLRENEPKGAALISEQKSTFTDEDFARAIFELGRNFCDERIRDAKIIGKALYGNSTYSKVQEQKEIPVKQPSGTIPNHQSHQNKRKTPMVIGILVAVIVVLLLVCLVRR